jgi:signal transduction histidine kinase/CheY-like chemotaxis protein/lipopolysaccharide biosynthesis regulator YciM
MKCLFNATLLKFVSRRIGFALLKLAFLAVFLILLNTTGMSFQIQSDTLIPKSRQISPTKIYYTTEQLIKKLHKSTDNEKIGILLKLAETLSGSEPERAIEFANQAQILLKQFKNNKTHINILCALSESYNTLGKDENARELANEALKKAENESYKSGAAKALYIIGDILIKAGNNNKSLEYYNKSLKIYNEIDDNQSQSKVLIKIGIAYKVASDYKPCLENYRKSMIVAEKSNDSLNLAVALNCIGDYYGEVGPLDSALTYDYRALMINEQINNRAGIGASCACLGFTYRRLQNYNKAFYYCLKAIEISEEIGNKRRLGMNYTSLGVIYLESGDNEKALSSFFEALKIFQILNWKLNIQETFDRIGETYFRMGENNKALDYYFKSLKLSKELDLKHTKLLIKIGKLYRTLGRFQVAMDYVNKSLAVANIIGNDEMKTKGYEELSEIYFAKGDYKKALENFRLFKQFNDTVFNKSVMSQIIEMQTKYETDKKEKEIKTLEYAAKLRELELFKQRNYRNYSLAGSLFILALATVFLYGYRQKARLNKELTEKSGQMRILNQDLSIAKEKAEVANQAKSTFLANMSHEIRTPMNAILGYTEILSRSAIDAQQKEYLASLNSSGRTLLELINDVLDISKIEAGKSELLYMPFNIIHTINDIVNIFKLKVNQKGLQLIIELSENLPEYIVLDELKVRQVLINLIGNAVKYTDKGYIKIAAFAVANTEEQTNLTIAIHDTGIGIPEAYRNKIFEAFEQADSHDNNKYGGTGLGLAISKLLVEQMNGQIFIESKENQGSIFKIVFKEVAISREATMEKQKFHLIPESIKFNEGIVLLVDDNFDNRNIIKGYLNNYPFEVIEAGNGKEALELLNRIKPDIVLMDIHMPVMDGYETLNLIRENTEYSNIPVIAITASAFLEDEQRAAQFGFNDYLRKPISLGDLMSCLIKFIKYEEIKSENIYQEAILPEIVINIPFSSELITYVEENIVPIWNELKDIRPQKTVVLFAEKMIEVGHRFNQYSFINYGSELISTTNSFNIDMQIYLIKMFPGILNQMKNSNKWKS